MSKIATVILAAGKGTRMESSLPKVLLPLNKRPMIHYVIDMAKAIGSKKTILVVGHKRELVIDAVKEKGVEWVVQSPQMGTGHALMQAGPRLKGFRGNLLVLSGDVPLLRIKTIKELILFHEKHDPLASVLTVEMEDPSGYGRVVRDDRGMVKQIVEDKDAGKLTM